MIRLALSVLAAFILTNPALAATDWKQELKSNIVTKAKGKMLYEDVQLCTVPPATKRAQATSLQLRIRSEAPDTGFISRDNFVAITVATGMTLIGGAECRDLEALIGNPDLDVNIFMAADGVQVEMKDNRTGQTNRTTTQWKDLFAE